ncbi:hypothetical protein Tco_0975676 [Tanacetum coccineum]|uniref:Uncharacterized protein n=1 Tax=Tanacetum coccineum TaxID=301880 RepID=A0ABQ5EF31_9ASTR
MMLQLISQLKLSGLSAPNDSYLNNRIWMKRTKHYSFDHLFCRVYLSVLVDKPRSARDGLKTANTDSGTNEESRADDISKKINLEDLSEFLKDTRSAFFTPDSHNDDRIIVTYKSEEEEANKEDTHDTSHDVPKDTSVPPPPSPKSAQIQELMAQVAELKNIYWELPAEFLNLPSQVSSIQEKLKILDSLPSLLHKVTDTLNRFATMVENASGATSMNVPSAGKATASPAEGEKNTKDADTNLKDELVDLLGKNVVTQYYTKKLLFDKYYDKMLKRKKSPKITNCEVLTKKGPITLKIYREDGSDEVISNLKLTQTKQELKIDLNKPLKEQDPLNELNELANKKRKRTSDLKDHSRLFVYSNMGRLLGSVPEPFSLSVASNIKSPKLYAAVQKLKKGSWKELQFSLVDNSKLNVNKFEGDNTPILIQPPCYSASKVCLICMDIVNITRKRSKLDKHEHETNKVYKSQEFLAKHKSSQLMGLLAWQSLCSQSHPRVKIDHPMIRRFEGTRSKAKGAYEQT